MVIQNKLLNDKSINGIKDFQYNNLRQEIICMVVIYASFKGVDFRTKF